MGGQWGGSPMAVPLVVSGSNQSPHLVALNSPVPSAGGANHKSSPSLPSGLRRKGRKGRHHGVETHGTKRKRMKAPRLVASLVLEAALPCWHSAYSYQQRGKDDQVVVGKVTRIRHTATRNCHEKDHCRTTRSIRCPKFRWSLLGELFL